MIMMRDDIVGAKIVYIGCAVLYLLMTGLDGDASPISPLREQIWLLSLLHYYLLFISLSLAKIEKYAGTQKK